MSDDIDFDDIGDELGDFDFNPGGASAEGGKGRSVVSDFKGSALDEFKGWKKRADIVAKGSMLALPPGYSAAASELSNIKDSASSLYDKTMKELEPTKTALRRMGKAALPTAEKLLPRSISSRLKRLTETPESYSSMSAGNADDQALAATMGSIFGVQQQQEQERAVKDDAKYKLDSERHKQSFGASKAVADGINRMVGYQDSILINYQKKSLELQHKQYFAARDLLEFMKAYGTDSSQYLKAISHNSALPNEQKVLLSEMWQARAMGSLGGMIAAPLADRMRNIPGNFAKNIGNKLSNGAAGMNDATGQMAEMAEMMGGEDGPTMGQMAGILGGGFVKDKLTGGIGKLGRKYVDRMGDDSKLRRVGERLAGGIANKEAWLNSEMRSGSRLGNALSMFASPEQGDQETINHNLTKDSASPTSWDMLSRRSLIEVIPGYLSRMLQQLTGIATGEKAERIVYSTEREEFVTQSQTRRDLKTQFGKTVNTGLKTSTDSIINLIDTKRKLSPEARLSFSKAIAKSTVRGELFDYANFTNADVFDTDGETIAKVVREFIGVDNTAREFKRTAGVNKLQSINTIENTFGGMRDVTKGYDELLNQYNLTGNKEALRGLGLTHKEGLEDKVNQDRKWDLIFQMMANGFDPDSIQFDDIDPEDPDGTINKLKVKVAEKQSNFESTKPSANFVPPAGLDSASVDSLHDTVRSHAADNKQGLADILGVLSEGMKISIDEESANTINSSMSVSGAMGRLLNAGMDGLRFGGDQVKKAGKRGMSIARFGLDKSKRVLSKLNLGGHMAEWIGDIKIKGTDTILLRKALLDAGEYIDSSTGKVIKSLKDITGEVVDAQGNVIISTQDYAKGLVTSTGKRIEGLISKGASKLFNIQSTLLAGIKGRATKILDFARNRVFAPKDVYVRGDATPRLYKFIFENRGYFSVSTGMVLRSHADIDGPVKDGEGNIVLTDLDIQKGLLEVGSDGNLINLKAGGLMSKLGSAGKTLLDKAKSIGTGIWNFGSEVLSAGRRVVSGLLEGLMGRLEQMRTGNSDRTVELLANIYDHMQLAMPVEGKEYTPMGDFIKGDKDQRKRSRSSERVKRKQDRKQDGVIGDADGDGIRDGGWRARLKAKATMLKSSAGEKLGTVGKAAAGLGIVSKLKGLFKSKKESEGETEDNSGGLLDTALNALGLGGLLGRGKDDDDGAAGGKGKKGKRGMLGKLKRVAGSPLRMSKGVIRGGMALAGAGASGLAMAGSAAATGLGWAGAGAGFLLTNPVGWGILAAGAAAFIGYKAFKYFSKRTKLEPLEKLRYLQYGIDVDNKTHVVAMRHLESIVNKKLVVQEGGTIKFKLNIDFVDIWNEVHGSFNASKTDSGHASAFRSWFFDRFIPILGTHKVHALRIQPKVDLLDIDDEMDNNLKGKFAQGVEINSEVIKRTGVNPLLMTISPFVGSSLRDNTEFIKALRDRISKAAAMGTEVDLANSKDLKLTEGSRAGFLKSIGRYDSEGAVDVKRQQILDMLTVAEFTDKERARFKEMTADEKLKFLREKTADTGINKNLRKFESVDKLRTLGRDADYSPLEDYFNTNDQAAKDKHLADFNAKNNTKFTAEDISELRKEMVAYKKETGDWVLHRNTKGEATLSTKRMAKMIAKLEARQQSEQTSIMNDIMKNHRDLKLPVRFKGDIINANIHHDNLMSFTSNGVFTIHMPEDGAIVKVEGDPENSTITILHSNQTISVLIGVKLKYGVNQSKTYLKGHMLGHSAFDGEGYTTTWGYRESGDAKRYELVLKYMSAKSTKLLKGGSGGINLFMKDKDGDITPYKGKEYKFDVNAIKATNPLDVLSDKVRKQDKDKEDKVKENKPSPLKVNVDATIETGGIEKVLSQGNDSQTEQMTRMATAMEQMVKDNQAYLAQMGVSTTPVASNSSYSAVVTENKT